MKLVIIDYGMGNIRSIVGAFKFLGLQEIVISGRLSEISMADRLVLPGVGSFALAMENIRKSGIDKILKKVVVEEKKPILGICLGMQLMGESSEEEGLNRGLGFISANITKFNNKIIKVPHVGFNQVKFPDNSMLYKGFNQLSDFYFSHSFQVQSDMDISQAVCKYGNKFIASYEVDNIVGVQFHPELSQTNGLRLLDNFIKLF